MSAKIHRDLFSIFYSIWCNPNTKLFQIVKYLLDEAPNNSRTWSIHAKHLAQLYGIQDLVDLLKRHPIKHAKFKEIILTKITSFYERKLRLDAANNSKMEYLNVSTLSLRGKPHPAIRGAETTAEVKEMRPHIKMLCGDYYSYAVRAAQAGGSGHCRLCGFILENIDHILKCPSTAEAKMATMEQLSIAVQQTKCWIDFQSLTNSKHFTQFVLDCTSLNLPNNFTVNTCDSALNNIFEAARKMVHAIHSERLRKLKKIENMKS